MLCLIGLTLETVKTRTRRGNAPRETASGTTGAVLFYHDSMRTRPYLNWEMQTQVSSHLSDVPGMLMASIP